MLVSREFWDLKVWLDESWLAWWSEAQETFEQSDDDYSRFADNLAWHWRLTGKDVRVAAPTLWAVFTGYPDGRRSAYQPAVAVDEAEIAPRRIRLQGFRRLR